MKESFKSLWGKVKIFLIDRLDRPRVASIQSPYSRKVCRSFSIVRESNGLIRKNNGWPDVRESDKMYALSLTNNGVVGKNMRHGATGRRSRNRNNNNMNRRGGHQGGHSQNRMQIYDSNGPDVRIRGTAYQICEKYMALAKDAASVGDRIVSESYLQHAEHYQRIINTWLENNAQSVERGQVADGLDRSAAGEGRGQASHTPQVQETPSLMVGRPKEDLGLPESIIGRKATTPGELTEA